MARDERDRASGSEVHGYGAVDQTGFRELVDEVFAELAGNGDYLYEALGKDDFRLQIAAAMFTCAGEAGLDRDALKKRVIDQFYTPTSAQSAAAR